MAEDMLYKGHLLPLLFLAGFLYKSKCITLKFR